MRRVRALNPRRSVTDVAEKKPRDHTRATTLPDDPAATVGPASTARAPRELRYPSRTQNSPSLTSPSRLIDHRTRVRPMSACALSACGSGAPSPGPAHGSFHALCGQLAPSTQLPGRHTISGVFKLAATRPRVFQRSLMAQTQSVHSSAHLLPSRARVVDFQPTTSGVDKQYYFTRSRNAIELPERPDRSRPTRVAGFCLRAACAQTAQIPRLSPTITRPPGRAPIDYTVCVRQRGSQTKGGGGNT